MVGLRRGCSLLVLVHMFLLQIQHVRVQGIDPVSQKLRRLNEQFQQFQALTQARLDMLVLNQNRNSSTGLSSRVEALSDHWRLMSHDLDQLKQSTTEEIEGLREWSRKIEKKGKRMEARMALLERNVRENRRNTQKQKSDPDRDISGLSVELRDQEERLGALQAQRDELLMGLKGLQESLKNQALRMTRLEGRLGDVLQFNGDGKSRGFWGAGQPLSSDITPQEYDEPPRRSPAQRGGRILDGHIQPRPGGISHSQTGRHAQKHPKTQKSRTHPESPPQIQIQYTNPTPQPTDHLTQQDPYHPQSQVQVQPQTRPYPLQQEQLQFRQTVPHHPGHIQPKAQQRSQSYHRRPEPSHTSRPRPSSHAPNDPEPAKDRQSRITQEAAHLKQQVSDVLPQPRLESHQPGVSGWDGGGGGGEEENDQKAEKSSAILNLLQLPVRQKIPAQPLPRKDATICNVNSMLFFPSASAENYVTFTHALPDLPELTVCLWVRVEASHIGTLLSYATVDNDNQLVLYGRDSSVTSSTFPTSSSSSSSGSSSSSSLDFVIGDPVYRRLPASSLLDGRWHHLCLAWSSIQGRFWHYTDRRLTSSGSSFRKGWEIPGGGSVVLGQEQDTVGGGFDPVEGFTGQMAGFRVWSRVLSAAEVEGVAGGRGVPRGVVLGMDDIKEVHGQVQQVACECLEHCV